MAVGETRILMVVASEFGSTAEVAAALAKAFGRGGARTDICPVAEVGTLDPYRAVVVASPIYNGAWLPEAEFFVRHNASALAQRNVAYVALSATMRRDTPANRAAVRSFLAPVLDDVPAVKPVAIGLFAGSINFGRLPWWLRLRMLLTTNLRHGDSRDWHAVEQWASDVLPLLYA